MNQHSKWSNDTFKVFEKPLKMNENKKKESTYNISAKSFIPTGQFDTFQPFDTKKESEEDDDVMNDLSQHLISSHLLDEEEEPIIQQNSSNNKSYVWDTQKEWSKSSASKNKLQDIWNLQPALTPPPSKDWPQFNDQQQSNRETEGDEFDPTLQFYHGLLYDVNTIQDMNLLSLNVTNPSLEETEAENVGEDMSTLQMMQTIFSDLSDEELQDTLARHDYDVDRAIESLLTKKSQVEPPVVAAGALAAGVPKKRQVCRHFLAGECYRKDCWFVHDLQEKVCKFWLQGTCLKGDSCEFSHVIDVQEVVANKLISSPPTKNSILPPKLSSQGDYPQLSSTVKKSITITAAPPVVIAPPPKLSKEEEFPSLASASKVNSSKKAAAAVKAPTGTPINFAEAAKKNKDSAVQQKIKNTRSAIQGGYSYHDMKKLTQHVYIPWLDTGSSLNSIYMKEREQAIEYGMLRNRFFSKATEYYLKGDGAKAKLYSMEAKHYNRLMQEMHTEASQRIFESRSTHEAFIDLHGLHQDEAVQIIEQRLNNLHSNYRGIIYIVTGTGHHSGNSGLSKKASKLKPAVEDYLKSENYRFAETSIVGDKNGGVFAVDLSF